MTRGARQGAPLFALLIGVGVGTCSPVFEATPLAVELER